MTENTSDDVIEETLEKLLHADEKTSDEKEEKVEKEMAEEKAIEEEEYNAGVDTQEEYDKLSDKEKEDYGI